MAINVWNQTSRLAKIRNLKDKDIALWATFCVLHFGLRIYEYDSLCV